MERRLVRLSGAGKLGSSRLARMKPKIIAMKDERPAQEDWQVRIRSLMLGGAAWDDGSDSTVTWIDLAPAFHAICRLIGGLSGR